jgi:hypothetical protein
VFLGNGLMAIVAGFMVRGAARRGAVQPACPLHRCWVL